MYMCVAGCVGVCMLACVGAFAHQFPSACASVLLLTATHLLALLQSATVFDAQVLRVILPLAQRADSEAATGGWRYCAFMGIVPKCTRGVPRALGSSILWFTDCFAACFMSLLSTLSRFLMCL